MEHFFAVVLYLNTNLYSLNSNKMLDKQSSKCVNFSPAQLCEIQKYIDNGTYNCVFVLIYDHNHLTFLESIEKHTCTINTIFSPFVSLWFLSHQSRMFFLSLSVVWFPSVLHVSALLKWDRGPSNCKHNQNEQ